MVVTAVYKKPTSQLIQVVHVFSHFFMRGNKTVLFCFSLPQNCRFYVPFFQRQIQLVNNFQQSLIFLKKLMTDSLHQYLLDTGIQMLQCKIQFLTWIYTLDASIQQLQKIRQLDRVYYNKTMWPKWKQEPDSQNRRQECNANLNTQEKKKIIRALNQSCLEQTKHAPDAMKTQSGPLGPQSRNARPPHAAPYWSTHLITGPWRETEALEWAHPPACDSTQTLQADTLNSRAADAGFSCSHTYTSPASSSTAFLRFN